jgi:hypothetical protein
MKRAMPTRPAARRDVRLDPRLDLAAGHDAGLDAGHAAGLGAARPLAAAATAESALPACTLYTRHLVATAGWIQRSLRASGGSSAHWSIAGGFSRAYPETTGYLITTLLALHEDARSRPTAPPYAVGADDALRAGEWLLSIQRADGAWNGGLHPRGGRAAASVFNTGQIVDGLVSLWRHTREARWLDAASRAGAWLAAGVGADGLWPAGDYRSGETPTYYTHVAWPMLELWSETRDAALHDAARRFLDTARSRRLPNGAFRGCGFDRDAAPTHTIAYTLRGFLECARLLGAWEQYALPCAEALERLRRAAELSNGDLPGWYADDWSVVHASCCLTGNAQLALCLLAWEQREQDLRIANAAAKLVDRVCSSQRLSRVLPGLQGAVGGSAPTYGRYLPLRYPNWAAKYHVDALLALRARLEREAGRA